MMIPSCNGLEDAILKDADSERPWMEAAESRSSVNTDDFDLIIGISRSMTSAFTVGVVAIGAVPPVHEVLVGLDGDEVNEPSA